MKKKVCLIMTTLIMATAMFGCANFEGMVNPQPDEAGEATGTTDAEPITQCSLGDINVDGVEDFLNLNGNVIEYKTNDRVVQEYATNVNYTYRSLATRIADIDNDGEDEIIALLECGNVTASYDIYILDKLDDTFVMRDFPQELESMAVTSGIGFEVIPTDLFSYKISYGEFSFDVSSSRYFTTSTKNKEQMDAYNAEWEYAIEKNMVAEPIGIIRFDILEDSEGRKQVTIWENIGGICGEVICTMACTLEFSEDNSYKVTDVKISERYDKAP